MNWNKDPWAIYTFGSQNPAKIYQYNDHRYKSISFLRVKAYKKPKPPSALTVAIFTVKYTVK